MGTVRVDMDGELLQRLPERHPGKTDRELIDRLAIIDVRHGGPEREPAPECGARGGALEQAVRAVHEARAESG